MDIELIEIVKQYTTSLNNGSLRYDIRAKIVKHVGDDGSFWYETSSHYRESPRHLPYTPGAGALSIEDAERKLTNYLKDFQDAILNGGDAVVNASFVG
jgi:hypothetical protein